ncbi:MAG TPA: hypothetical protein VFW16_12855 [Streptosporangiaceae bacterium]|nr:hypothetical protein [Streptosporangiaceae bacterium]
MRTVARPDTDIASKSGPVNSSRRKILATVITGNLDFAQSVFAGGWLFTANGTGVYAWAP